MQIEKPFDESDAIKARVREGGGTQEAVRDVSIDDDDYEDYAASAVTESDSNHTSTDFIHTERHRRCFR